VEVDRSEEVAIGIQEWDSSGGEDEQEGLGKVAGGAVGYCQIP
jgi:hypothetical protein